MRSTVAAMTARHVFRIHLKKGGSRGAFLEKHPGVGKLSQEEQDYVFTGKEVAENDI